MRQELNKDWTDAIREKVLSDGAVPSPEGWEAVGRRVRRSAALRRGGLAAAVLLPAIALLLWSPWRQAVSPPAAPAPRLAESSGGVPPEPPASLRSGPLAATSPSAFIPDRIGGLPNASQQESTLPDAGIGGLDPEGQRETSSPRCGNALPEQPATRPAENAASENPDQVLDEVPPAAPPFIPAEEPESLSRRRPRISVGVSAGSGPIQRETGISLQSAPYIAALAFMNTMDPGRIPKAKSNSFNTRTFEAQANHFYAESTAGAYRHSIPLVLGLSVRAGLTPDIGLESGVEYTYLHSVIDFADSSMDEQLHFLGIPLRLNARLWSRGGFDLYAGVGGKTEKCIAASVGRVFCEEPRLQWSAEAFGGIQYRMGDQTKLYFQPALTWYLSRTDLVTYRTEHPLGLSLQAGLRFDL